MIRKIQSRLLTIVLRSRHMISASKTLRDADELTDQEMADILGTQLQQQKQKPFLKTHSHSSDVALGQQQQSSLTTNPKDFYYGLMPQFNANYPICKDPQEIIIQQTPNQNLFKSLNLPIDCSFDDYTQALNMYRTEVDLYGDETPKSVILNDSLQFKDVLVHDSPYLEKARERHLVNISIPGCIECEDPRNFMELRPIQQFRHTPLVPISESAMQRHKEMLERYHRKQFIFEVKKQSVVNGFLLAIALGIGGYLIMRIVEKEEQKAVAFSRIKYQRIKGEYTEQPVFKI